MRLTSALVPAADTLTNEQLVWELLYDPAYRIPGTTDAEAAWQRAVAAAAAADAGSGAAADGMPEAPGAGGEAVDLGALAAHLRQVGRLVAERAFWDSVRCVTAVKAIERAVYTFQRFYIH